MPSRHVRFPFTASLALAAAILAVAPPATGAGGRLTIGAPTLTPAHAVGAQAVSLTAKVTSAGAALKGGSFVCQPTAGGKALPHTQSLRGGVARCAFTVPATATSVRVVLTVKAGGRTATRTFTFAVGPAPKPSISIGDVSVLEGNSGTTAMSFPVTLSKASTQTVSVSYATADGTASSSSDYTAASGTLTFAPGATTSAIVVSVIGDTMIEPDETLTVSLSAPLNATIARSTATGTIRNDDTQVPVIAGEWQGSIPTGDYIYFEVTADRGMSYFRMNDIKEPCSPGGYFEGTLAFQPTTRWPIADDGTSGAANSWSGTDVEGDFTFTYSAYKVTAKFSGASATGTIRLQEQFTWKGTAFSCDTGDIPWTASKVG